MRSKPLQVVLAHPYGVFVHVALDKQQWMNACKRLAWSREQAESAIPDEPAGVTVQEGNAIALGWFDQDDSTLVHELVHAGILILQRAGIDPTHATGEPLAYLTDNLYARIKTGKLRP